MVPYITSWYTKIGYQDSSRYYRKCFCVPTVHPIASKGPIEANIQRHKFPMILASIVGPVGAVGCTVGTHKTFPVVPKHTLVSKFSVTRSYEM